MAKLGQVDSATLGFVKLGVYDKAIFSGCTCLGYIRSKCSKTVYWPGRNRGISQGMQPNMAV